MTEEQPIRIAIVGDTHADDSSRFEEHNEIMAWVADDAAARGCCVMLHAGDVFERRSRSSERLAVVDWIARVARNNMSLVMIAGNHDDPLDIELLGKLRRIGPDGVTIRTATRAESILVSAPGHYDVLQVHCLPWPRKGTVATLLRLAGGTMEDIDIATTDALRSVLRGFGANRWSDGTPSLVLAHCMVRGSRTTEAQPPLVGMDFELGVEDLALARADFYALGHIHLGQAWETDDARSVVYTGSPRRCNYGELEEKSYLVVDFVRVSTGWVANWQRVPTPAPKMVHFSAEYLPANSGETADGTAGLRFGQSPEVIEQDLRGADVRLRYQVRAPDRVAARADLNRMAAILLERGAKNVKLEEEVVVETRARAPEVALATSTADKLSAYWAQQAVPPPEEDRERLLLKVDWIEEASS